MGWTGSGTCVAGTTCTYFNPYYSQVGCLAPANKRIILEHDGTYIYSVPINTTTTHTRSKLKRVQT